MESDEQAAAQFDSMTILENTEANRRWIEERRPVLARLYPHKFICVQGRRVVAIGVDLKAVLADVLPAPDMVCEYMVP